MVKGILTVTIDTRANGVCYSFIGNSAENKPRDNVMRIALVADRGTATSFKLAGLSEVNIIEKPEEAEKRIDELLERRDLAVILATERLVDQIPGLAEKVAERKYPLIVPIPESRGRLVTKTDLIVELIRRKAGIEVKL